MYLSMPNANIFSQLANEKKKITIWKKLSVEPVEVNLNCSGLFFRISQNSLSKAPASVFCMKAYFAFINWLHN